jgi:PsbP-like protein
MVLVILLVCSVVFASGCVSNNKISNTTKTYAQNNISFTYPGSWEVVNATSPNAVAAVADPNSIQNGTPTTLVVIQKPDVPAGSDINSIYTANYVAFFNNTNYQRISDGNVTVNGANALENIYETNTTVNPIQYSAVWLNESGSIYVILSAAKITDFENQTSNFNLILNSFKVQ